MKNFIYALTLLLLAASGDTFSSERCQTKINSTCELKNYARSPVNSRAYAVFQGYVIGTANMYATQNSNEFCWFGGTDEERIAAAKRELLALDNCKTTDIQQLFDDIMLEFRMCL